MSAGVVRESSTAGVVGQATGIAKATGIVMQADVAVEGVVAVVETVVRIGPVALRKSRSRCEYRMCQDGLMMF